MDREAEHLGFKVEGLLYWVSWMENLKTKFLNVYSNLPLNIRKEVIVVLDEQPISWNVAYLEISGDTELGKKILKKLEELKIL